MTEEEKVGLNRIVELLSKLEVSAYNARTGDFAAEQINPSIQASQHPSTTITHQYLLGLIRKIRKEVYKNFPTDDNYQLEHVGPQKLMQLYAKFCYQKQHECPLCGSMLVQRNSKYGTFYGCRSFPKCRGSRKNNGMPALNKELKAFLITKEKEKAPPMNKNFEQFKPGRFADL